MANAIVTAMAAVSFGNYASALFARESKVWAKIFAALIAVLMTGVNIVGSKLVANSQTSSSMSCWESRHFRGGHPLT
ncbi:MAG: hypothetical protein WBF34_10365 [Streptosporangiaceae bacterium]